MKISIGYTYAYPVSHLIATIFAIAGPPRPI
jgi:hypothetical protein